MPLSSIEVNPSTPAQASVIWFHGLGASARDFANAVAQLQLPAALPLRFVFPHAPVRPITLYQGAEIPGWFDVTGFDLESRQDRKGLEEINHSVCALVQQELDRGIPANKIVLAGFSQGGALALYAGLRYPETLGGILALSTYLPLASALSKEANAHNKSIAIFMAHGNLDPVIPITWGEISREAIATAGYQVDWRTYPMEHTLCLTELQDISEWLVDRF